MAAVDAALCPEPDPVPDHLKRLVQTVYAVVYMLGGTDTEVDPGLVINLVNHYLTLGGPTHSDSQQMLWVTVRDFVVRQMTGAR